MDLFDLSAKISLDTTSYESAVNGAISGAKAIGAAIGVAGTALGAFVTQSVGQYAEFEQNVGGVQKLYGNMGMGLQEYADSVGKTTGDAAMEWATLEQAQSRVMQNANEAFRTTGMSANEYMQTATSFSAALINSLNGDTLAAADVTQVAMEAIADNWNTFGGDIGMIQGAFQGFAKQNYTMLDNLSIAGGIAA